MLTLSLTRHPHARKELLLGKTLRVVSRSGLNPTERALIELLPELGPAPLASPLFLGGRTGALAMAAWLRGQAQGRITLHTLDAHTADTLARNLTENNAPRWCEGAATGFAVETGLDLSAYASPGATAFWQMTAGDGTAELHLWLLEQLISEGAFAQIVIAAEELNPTFLERFRKACPKLKLRKTKDLTLLIGTVSKPLPAEKRPDHRATFQVSLKGHDPISLETLPGCFCHRRADMGGLALTEVVAELVAFDPGDRVMDLGCGCGMDGLLLATAFPEKKLHIDYQDSAAPARDATLANLRRYPHPSRFLFSADGEGDPNAYDLLLANPPYFGDWRIAEFFIQTAHRLLKRGSLIAFVSKRAAKPTELLQAAHFTLLSATPRRGYTILLAQKR